jgi:hypothetical protein
MGRVLGSGLIGKTQAFGASRFRFKSGLPSSLVPSGPPGNIRLWQVHERTTQRGGRDVTLVDRDGAPAGVPRARRERGDRTAARGAARGRHCALRPRRRAACRDPAGAGPPCERPRRGIELQPCEPQPEAPQRGTSPSRVPAVRAGGAVARRVARAGARSRQRGPDDNPALISGRERQRGRDAALGTSATCR